MAEQQERDIETNLRAIILGEIIAKKKDFVLFDNKDLTDIVIFRNNESPKVFFLEVKHYSGKNGRIGFGDKNGNGFQPEILAKRPKYLEDNLLWIFSKDDYFCVLTNADCLKYRSGDGIGEKQNNFTLKLFEKEKHYNEDELVKFLGKWLER